MRILGPVQVPGFYPGGGGGHILAVLEGPGARPCACDGLSYKRPRSLGALAPVGPTDGDGNPPAVVYSPNPSTPATPPTTGAPPGYTDWTAVGADLTQKLQAEPNKSKQAILTQGLGIAAAAAGIPVVGWVVAGAAAVLAFFGITARGTTTHVDPTSASTAAWSFNRSKIMPLYNGLPDDGKAMFENLFYNWDAWMWTNFSSWWGGIIASFHPAPLTTANFQPPNQSFDSWMQGENLFVDYFYHIMHSADATSVNDNMNAWYFKPLQDQVLLPLDKFMLVKYNETVAQYEAANGGTPSGLLLSTAGISPGLLGGVAIAGLVGAMLLGKKGRRSA